MAQAWFIYKSLEQQMHEAGTDLSKVVQQNIYVKNAYDAPAVEKIASIIYNGRIPPTTIVPVDDGVPYKEILLEIEAITLVP